MSSRARAALDAVVGLAGSLGLDPSGARVVREGTSVLVGLPSCRVLARVDDRAGAGVGGQVAVAEVLVRTGVPAIRLAGPGPQPHVVRVGPDRAPVTLWRWEEVLAEPVDRRALGALARRLHDGTAGAAGDGAPVADPLTAIARVLADAPGPDEDVAVLDRERQRLSDVWRGRRRPGDPVVHADLHVDNVLVTPDGLVLADLELAGRGPWAYDVAPQVVAVRRYGAPARHLDAFLEGYGRAPDADDLAALVEVYELWVTAWAVANRNLDAAHEREASVRVDRWRSGDHDVAWTLR